MSLYLPEPAQIERAIRALHAESRDVTTASAMAYAGYFSADQVRAKLVRTIGLTIDGEAVAEYLMRVKQPHIVRGFYSARNNLDRLSGPYTIDMKREEGRNGQYIACVMGVNTLLNDDGSQGRQCPWVMHVVSHQRETIARAAAHAYINNNLTS